MNEIDNTAKPLQTPPHQPLYFDSDDENIEEMPPSISENAVEIKPSSSKKPPSEPSSPVSSRFANSAPPSNSKQERFRKRMFTELQMPLSRRLCMSAPSFNKRRIQESNELYKKTPTIISFKEKVPQLNLFYNPLCDSCYFKQCFETVNLLGEGSFGRAVLVKSKDKGEKFAVKFTIDPTPSTRIRDMRVAEIKKHESIPVHPNLVQLLCAWEEKGYIFLQMELCEKRGLDTICNANPKTVVPDDQIWSYFIDASLAISHLHRNNLIHCDIKPANIFLTSDDVCKLGDFGLLFNEATDVVDNDMNEGDGKYLAFEAFKVGPTKPGDIFSLGITLLDLSTKKILPSNCDRFWLKDGRVIDEFLEDIPNNRVALINDMTNIIPCERPTISDILNMKDVDLRMNERQLSVYNQFEQIQNNQANPSNTTQPIPNNNNNNNSTPALI